MGFPEMYSPGGWKSTAEGAATEVTLQSQIPTSHLQLLSCHVRFSETGKGDFLEKGLAPHSRTLVSSAL